VPLPFLPVPRPHIIPLNPEGGAMAQSYVFAGVGGYYGTKDKSGKAGVSAATPLQAIGTTS
jgi:hypothetical protein